MTARSQDRVEALRSEEISKKVEAYAEFVADAIEQRDVTMASDVFMKLECLFAEGNRRAWSDADEEQAEKLLRHVLRRRRSTGAEDTSPEVEKVIADSKALARDSIDRARKRAMKSVTDVERDKAERWGKD